MSQKYDNALTQSSKSTLKPLISLSDVEDAGRLVKIFSKWHADYGLKTNGKI